MAITQKRTLFYHAVEPSFAWRLLFALLPCQQLHRAIVHGPSPVSSAPSVTLIVFKFTACMSPSLHPPLSACIFIGVFDSPRLSALRIGEVVQRSRGGFCSSTYLEDATYFSTRLSPFSRISITHASISLSIITCAFLMFTVIARRTMHLFYD